MSPEPIPFACDLSRFSPAQREREKRLLAGFKSRCTHVEESERGWRFFVPSSEESLREVAELLALERLCCPFLEFHLEVSAAETATVHIFGDAGAKPFVAAEFMAQP